MCALRKVLCAISYVKKKWNSTQKKTTNNNRKITRCQNRIGRGKRKRRSIRGNVNDVWCVWRTTEIEWRKKTSRFLTNPTELQQKGSNCYYFGIILLPNGVNLLVFYDVCNLSNVYFFLVQIPNDNTKRIYLKFAFSDDTLNSNYKKARETKRTEKKIETDDFRKTTIMMHTERL